MSLFFVTGNDHKFTEVSGLIPGIQRLTIDLTEPQELDSKKIVEHKLREARKHTKEHIAVEDVSFSLPALGGLPGPFIKWFIQSLGAKGLYELAKKLGDDRVTISATVGLMIKNTVTIFTAELPGKVVAPRGDTSFGFDPIFQPDGMSKTFGELDNGVKNVISHRAKAWAQVLRFVQREKIL